MACATVAGICADLLARGRSVGLCSLQGAVMAAPDSGGASDQLHRILRHLAQLTPADQAPPPQWPLDDHTWLRWFDQAKQVQTSIERSIPLPLRNSSRARVDDVWVLRFAERSDVVFDHPLPSVLIDLDAQGTVCAIERPMMDTFDGAA